MAKTIYSNSMKRKKADQEMPEEMSEEGQGEEQEEGFVTKMKAMKKGKGVKEMKDDEMEGKSKKDADKLSAEDCKMLCEQIEQEYAVSGRFMRPKWDKWAARLALYNNQRRDDDAVGDPLLFTIHQTVLASLYDDKLMVEFEGRERGDDDQAENLNILSAFDVEQMDKKKLDYIWDWDTGFFGRGLVLLQEFDADTKTPVPENIDPLTFRRDPYATSVNGDMKGCGAAQYMGRDITLTKRQLKEMQDLGIFSHIDDVKSNFDFNSDTERNKRLRRDAQGYNQDDLKGSQLKGDNENFMIVEWYTWYCGSRYLVTLANDRKLILRCTKLKTAKWPILDRALYPMAYDWDGVSIPDLCEDKQRARAILQNLALKGVQATLYPTYLYNQNLIKNKASIAKFQFNKFVGVKGNPVGAVQPLERKGPEASVTWILNVLDAAAQQATATPDIQQGAVTEKNKSATEIAKVSQGVDTRYSLAAKIFGWSEQAFWKQWYELYQIYFKEGVHTKTVRISGVFGPTWKDLNRDSIVGKADPDIKIESKVLSEAKRMNQLNMFTVFFNQAVALDGGTNKRSALKYMGKLLGLTSDVVNTILPKTFDEYEAEQENEAIAKDKLPKVTMSQNHVVHIEIHGKAEDTPAKLAHIKAHYLALYGQRENPALKPTPEQVQSSGQGPSPMEQGIAPSPRDMAQSQIQLQAPNTMPQQG